MASAEERSVQGVGGGGMDARTGEFVGKAGDHGFADGVDVGEDAAGEGDIKAQV